MRYKDDVSEGPVTVCVYMRTVLDVFPKTQRLLYFRGFLEVAVLYYVTPMSPNDVSGFNRYGDELSNKRRMRPLKS